ncbi:hypothetical protein P8C59_001155 [Phyllachora maydis]|uniref:Velvet domain-containing protein n=1 Tax=Phyllachora maydis TaxID=1825666 RepID=A0AAD9M9W1_9PEZI|nr:hypothetical protein P8C59_001155 [Phyllachora maydis]
MPRHTRAGAPVLQGGRDRPVDHDFYGLVVCQQPGATTAQIEVTSVMPVITPGPIVQLTYRNRPASTYECEQLGRAQVSAVLYDDSGRRMVNEMRAVGQQRMVGDTSAAPTWGSGTWAGLLFQFDNLSVRTPGTYRLQFWLIMSSPAFQDRYCHRSERPVSKCTSDVFYAYPGGVRKPILAPGRTEPDVEELESETETFGRQGRIVVPASS